MAVQRLPDFDALGTSHRLADLSREELKQRVVRLEAEREDLCSGLMVSPGTVDRSSSLFRGTKDSTAATANQPAADEWSAYVSRLEESRRESEVREAQELAQWNYAVPDIDIAALLRQGVSLREATLAKYPLRRMLIAQSSTNLAGQARYVQKMESLTLTKLRSVLLAKDATAERPDQQPSGTEGSVAVPDASADTQQGSRMRSHRGLDHETWKAQAVRMKRLRDQGKSLDHIAKQFRTTRKTVRSWLDELAAEDAERGFSVGG
jgi:hypothetical protein